MRMRGLVALLAALAVVLAGCGGSSTTKTVTAPAASTSTTTPTVAAAPNCRFVHGKWVTVGSTTACVPDPNFATGNKRKDETGVTPSCDTCTMADWNRAERKAYEASLPPPAPPTTSAATPTPPPTPPPTPKPKPVPTPAPASFASGYPVLFESSFDQSCIAGGVSYAICACSLKQIEATTSYSTFSAAVHAILTGDLPSWYKQAVQGCAASGP